MIHNRVLLSNGISEKRGPGRPKGLPRTGGRQKGTPNRTTADLREQITAARPVEFLIKVAEGRRIRIGPQAGPGGATYAYPSVEQRFRACEMLMKKILPDLTATEVTGAGGSPLIPERPVSVDEIAATAIALLERHRARTEAPAIEGDFENEPALRLLERHKAAACP